MPRNVKRSSTGSSSPRALLRGISKTTPVADPHPQIDGQGPTQYDSLLTSDKIVEFTQLEAHRLPGDARLKTRGRCR